MKYWLKGKYNYIGEWREDGEENMWIRMKFSSSVVGGQIKSETEKKKKTRNSSLRILFRNKNKQLKEQILLEGKFGAESWYYHLTI